MKISAFCFNPFGVMTYLLWDPLSKEAAIIDPGMLDEVEINHVDNFIKSHDLRLTHLINTHLHLDHIFGDNYISQRYGLGVEASELDAPLGAKLSEQMARFGMKAPGAKGVEVAHPLHDGDKINIGDESLEVIATPGHSPGSISLYSPTGHFVIVGDTLFKGNIGRTDLEGGSTKEIVRSIRERLYALPDETLVCPGHGTTTTIGDEKRHNRCV